MNEQDLKQLFANMDSTPDANAKAKTVAAALAAFDETQAAGEKDGAGDQGSATIHRLTPETHSTGSRTMNQTIANNSFQRWLYSGLASAAVLVIGVFIVQQMPLQTDFQIPGGGLPSSVDESGVVLRERRIDADKNAGTTLAQVAKMDSRVEPTPSQSPKEHVGTEMKGGNIASQFGAEVALSSDAAERVEGAAGNAAAASGGRVVGLEQETVTAHKREVSGQEGQVAMNKMLMVGSALEEAVQTASRHQTPAAPASATLGIVDATAGPYYKDEVRDRFESVDANPIKRVIAEPVSTFSVDVDTSSYSFVRRELNAGVLPQKAAVRTEEMVNYFPYEYPLPADRRTPFNTNVAVIDAPWKPGNKLVRIGIQGYDVSGPRPRTNLVFLLDVSGSMDSPDKLPLVKQSMGLLLSSLQAEDTVAIAVYAGASGTVLPPTPVRERQKILTALSNLAAGGSTAGAAGIQLAYQLAESNFIKEGVNRVILATDGDFNVGINDLEELKAFVERKRESGVFLSVLGFGQGNYHDALMQTLAQNGNGVAAYIDTLGEAQKVLVEEATSTLFPIASDVKIQVEFNPAAVSEYRLLGYETRALAQEDFNNDAVDAGDIGAGHSVTALYEITPAGSDSGVFTNSRYADSSTAKGEAKEYGFLQLRYKRPGEKASRLIRHPISIAGNVDAAALREARFASAVAGFAELLKGGKYTGSWGYKDALQLVLQNRGEDQYGYRSELAQLIRKAEIADAM